MNLRRPCSSTLDHHRMPTHFDISVKSEPQTTSAHGHTHIHLHHHVGSKVAFHPNPTTPYMFSHHPCFMTKPFPSDLVSQHCKVSPKTLSFREGFTYEISIRRTTLQLSTTNVNNEIGICSTLTPVNFNFSLQNRSILANTIFYLLMGLTGLISYRHHSIISVYNNPSNLWF